MFNHHLPSRNLQAAGLLVAFLTVAPLAAQFDYDLEKRTSARLGQDLVLDVVNGPATSFVLVIPSATSGPTPLALIDPVDTRSLAVGVDFIDLMSVLITDGNGDASYSLPLPNNPSISGYELHWQTASLLFGATLIGEISNDVVTLTGATNTGVVAPNGLQFARALSASLVNVNNNNSASDVLITGGGDGTLTAATGLASTELWDFRRMRFTTGPTMSSARALHSAVRLNDGRVLIIGGADQNGIVLSSCEIYNPNTNSFSTTGSMGTPRILHGASVLADGRVMVAGGTSTLVDVTAAITSTLQSAEIYNPATGSWSGAANIGGYRLAPALSLLPNGQIMVSGGVQVSFFFGFPISAISTTNVQRYNPGSNNWSNGPSMSQGRAGHQYNQVTLNDGRILMTGGINVPNLLGAQTAAPISGAEVYNPTSNSWQTVNMPNARALHSATVLADGRVAACGGAQGTLTTPISIANVDVFNPSTNTWSSAPALTGARASHTANLMPDGTLVLFGGQGATTSLTTIETLRF
jgi:N-acetylneuraminic acid mutarotase